MGDLQSPLHLATYLNLTRVVKELVEKGASLELQDHDGNTALHVACQQGQVETASEMTRHVSPSKLAPVLETQNWKGEETECSRTSLTKVRGNLKSDCDLFAGLACLHLAALNRQHQIISDLAKKGANLNIQVSLGNLTLICFVVYFGHDSDSPHLTDPLMR